MTFAHPRGPRRPGRPTRPMARSSRRSTRPRRSRSRAVGEFVEDYDYARSANPTRSALETALGELEGGWASAFSSGMAATHALITAVCSAGDHIVLPSDLYGGTFRLVDKVLARFGITYTLVDQTDLDALAAAVTERPGWSGSRRRPTPC